MAPTYAPVPVTASQAHSLLLFIISLRRAAARDRLGALACAGRRRPYVCHGRGRRGGVPRGRGWFSLWRSRSWRRALPPRGPGPTSAWGARSASSSARGGGFWCVGGGMRRDRAPPALESARKEQGEERGATQQERRSLPLPPVFSRFPPASADNCTTPSLLPLADCNRACRRAIGSGAPWEAFG